MEHRNGTCGSCGATYQIPASFPHDRARCKECGGTVEIEPAGSSSDPSAGSSGGDAGGGEPELVPYIPSGKKGEGPSMKEKLLARRRAEAGDADAPAADEFGGDDLGGDDFGGLDDLGLDDDASNDEPAEEPARKKKATAGRGAARKSSGRGGRKTAGRGRAGAGRSRAKAAADDDGDGGSSRKRAGSRGGSRAGSRGRSKGKSGGSGSKTPMLIGIAGLVLLLGGAAFLFKDDLLGGTETVDAAENAPEEVAGDAGAETPAEDAAATDAPTGEPAGESGADAGSDDTAAAGDDAAAADEALAAATDEPEKRYHPDDVDLSPYGPYESVDNTTDEEWAEIQSKMADAMNRDIGAGQTRAQKFLKEQGRKAVPAILNYMLGLDFVSEDGTNNGKLAQRMLMDICNGTNYDWREHGVASSQGHELYYAWFNKTVTAKWCTGWEQTLEKPIAWKNLAKLSDEEYAEWQASLGKTAPPTSSDLDLLNED